jgi:hypothetical protein
MRFARVDVRVHIVSLKDDHGLLLGPQINIQPGAHSEVGSNRFSISLIS